MLVQSKTVRALRDSAHHVQPGQGKTNEEARAMAISPRPPKGARGAYELQVEPVDELDENMYP